MPVDVSSIPAEDREDFQRRLQAFGMDLASVQEPLSVTPAAKVALQHGPRRESARAPFLVQTTDLAQVKRMIGVDDRVYRSIASKVALPGPVTLGSKAVAGRATALRDSEPQGFRAAPGLAGHARTSDAVSDEHLRELDRDAVDNVRLAARAYVRGDSSLVASYSPLFAKTLGTITVPVWALLTVTVAAGSVLEFGPGVNALVAYQVIVEEGGRIVSRGHLTVSCTRFRKPGRFVRPSVATGLTSSVFRPIFSE